MPLAAGTRLGPYEIVAPVGAAAWARCTGRATRVSIARRDRGFKRTVHGTLPARSAHRCVAEPDICRLYDVGKNYPVMEFIEGSQIAPVVSGLGADLQAEAPGEMEILGEHGVCIEIAGTAGINAAGIREMNRARRGIGGNSAVIRALPSLPRRPCRYRGRSLPEFRGWRAPYIRADPGARRRGHRGARECSCRAHGR